MVNEKQKCVSNWKRKNICEDFKVKFIRQKACTSSKQFVFFKKTFHLNKNIFTELFHFQKLPIATGIMVNSPSVNVIGNRVSSCL